MNYSLNWILYFAVDSTVSSVQVDVTQRSYPSTDTGEFLTSGMQDFVGYLRLSLKPSSISMNTLQVPTLQELLPLKIP